MGVLATGCRSDLGGVDGIFYDGDGRTVHCAANLDTEAGNSLASIDTALDRAVERNEVVELYAHRPELSVPLATIEHVLAGASARNLPFVTYADFAAGGGTGPGIALSFDDSGVSYWMEARPLFLRYQARVTFFVSRYFEMSADIRGQLRELANDGHDVEAHSVLHLRAPSYVEDRGLRAYLDDEALPSIEGLRSDGYAVTAYAYPYGARTDELDRAISEHVPVLRSVSFAVDGVADPCPN
jgi:peptidoglycan/xylan/chitin deacetylase (PgdA/CDA1 family)